MPKRKIRKTFLALLAQMLMSAAIFSSSSPPSAFSQSLAAIPTHELPLELPPMLGELKSRTDELAFDKFVQRSTLECEAFRISLRDGSASQPSIDLISKACREFKSQSSAQLANRASIANFDLKPKSMRTAVSGDSLTAQTGAEFYDAFQGKWFGKWNDQEVDHHWGKFTTLPEPLVFQDDRLPLKLLGYQYAWVGDGYALNHLATSEISDTQPKTGFLLGYVVHLKDGDVTNETARRPHVGIIAGPDRLIWITGGEVFLEEVIRDEKKVPTKYIITGFRYRFADNRLNVNEGFQAIYSKSANKREPWFGFPIKIKCER